MIIIVIFCAIKSSKIQLFLIIFVSLKKMMKLQDTNHEMNNSAKVNLASENEIPSPDDIFSPIDELGLMVNRQNKKDIDQINKLLFEIMDYPNTNLAKIHCHAMRLGNFDIENKMAEKTKAGPTSGVLQKSSYCACCGFVRQDHHINLCTDLDSIKNMGTSTCLFFDTFKNLSYLLIIMTVFYSFFALVTNIIAAKNNSNSQYTVDYLTISLSSKQSVDSTNNRLFYYIQCWIGAVVMLIWIFLFIVIKHKQFKQSQQYDDDTVSASDYSVVMEGLPIDITQEQLQKNLDGYYKSVTTYRQTPDHLKRPLKIMKMSVGKPFYLSDDSIKDNDLKEIEQQLEKKKQLFLQWIVQRQDSSSFSQSEQKRQSSYKEFYELLKKRQQKMIELTKAFKQKLKQKQGNELTTAFVTFQTNIARNLIVYLNEVNLYSRIKSLCKDNNKFVLQRMEQLITPEIAKAPQPQDIIWANIGLNDCSIYSRKIFTYSVTIVLLGACFAAVYGLNQAQSNNSADRIISIAISVVIALVNIVLGQVIKFLTVFEKDYTITNYQTSLAIKIILAQMINSILTPVISAYYINKTSGVYKTGGLVDNIFMMAITNSLVPPIMLLCDPSYIFSKLLRCLGTRPSTKLVQNQKQHNLLHEGTQFEVGYSYIYLVNLFMFVCFFVSLQPIVSIIALIGYVAMYWIQKYCLFYRYKRPVPGSDFINRSIYKIIFFGPLIYSLGSLTWANIDPNGIPPEALVPNLISVGLSVILILIPMNALEITCFITPQTIKQTKYEDDRIFFPSEYDRLNPTTSDEGIADFKQFMQKKHADIKKLSKEQQENIGNRILNGAKRGQLNNYNPMMSQLLGNNIGSIMGPALPPSLIPNQYPPQHQSQMNYSPMQMQPMFQPHQMQQPMMSPMFNPMGQMNQMNPMMSMMQMGYGNMGGYNPYRGW